MKLKNSFLVATAIQLLLLDWFLMSGKVLCYPVSINDFFRAGNTTLHVFNYFLEFE